MEYGIYVNLAGGDCQILQSTIGNVRSYGLLQPSGTTSIQNSIVDSRNYGIYAYNSGYVRSDHNLVFANGTAYVNTEIGEGDVNKDPIFANAAIGDVSLAAGSPAINAGADVFVANQYGHQW